MPTPTPIPSNQIVQAVQASQNIIDNAVQQGIVGVLLLFGIAAVLYFATQLLKAYFQRNVKPDNSGVNEAIKAMADGNIRSAEREERLENERRQERVEWRKHIEERDTKFIEAVSHLSDGYNRMGDVLVGQAELQKSIVADHKADVTTITTIKNDTEIILELIKKIEERLQNQADCVDVAERLKKVEELFIEKSKRATDSQPIVVIQPPANLIPDSGEPKAA